MSNWELGDMALCVRGGPIPGQVYFGAIPPLAGQLFTVVKAEVIMSQRGQVLYLWLEDGPKNIFGEACWAACRFIKVTPPADMIADERILEVTA